MARFLFLPIAILISSHAFAWDYSTSPCIPPADLNPAENTANLPSNAGDANNAIATEIRNSVGANLAMPLRKYSNAAPSRSELYLGDVGVTNGQVSINGVDSPTGSTSPPPCVIQLKSADVK